MLDTSLTIIQANLNKSRLATESILEIGIKEKADIILVQEPWLITENGSYIRSITHLGYIQLLPPCQTTIRPRTITYIRRGLTIETTQLAIDDPDIQVLQLKDKGGYLLQIINVYNERDRQGVWTTHRALLQL